MTWTDVIWLVALIPVAFVQNMVFTAVSRSRNSGDPSYHRWWAYASNGIWLVCQFFIWKHFWAAFSEADYLAMALMAVIYTLSTAEGSVYMMRKMLAKETGARKVGADEKREQEFAHVKSDIEDIKTVLEQVISNQDRETTTMMTMLGTMEQMHVQVARLKARVDGAGL